MAERREGEAAIDRIKPYRERPVSFLGLREERGWTLKSYGISAHGERPSGRQVEDGERLAASLLPDPARTGDRYGMGFLIVHHAADGLYVLTDWWTQDNMLRHHIHRRNEASGNRFLDLGPRNLAACAWELEVLHFERNAWVETVLADPGADAMDAYLARTLEGRI